MKNVLGHLRSAGAGVFLVQGLVLGMGLVSSVQLARGLGPAGRGELAAAMLWPSMFVYLFSVGLVQAVLYYAARADGRAESILGTACVFVIGQSLAAVVVGWWAIPLLLARQSAEVVGASRLFLLMIPVALLTQYGSSILQARERFTAFSALHLLIPGGYMVGVAVFQATERLSIWNVVVLLLVLNAAALGAVAILLRDVLGTLRFDSALGRRMLRYGVQVQAGDVTQVANLRLDQALLAGWFPSASYGLYVAAASAAGVSQVLATAARIVYTPRVAGRAEAAERVQTLTTAFRRFWLWSLLGTLALALVMPLAIPFVFGEAFREAIPVALILLVAGLALGAKHVLAGGAQALGSPWLASRAEIAGCIATVLCLPLLLPTLGIIGAALATLASYTVQLVTIVYGLHRVHSLQASALLFRPAVIPTIPPGENDSPPDTNPSTPPRTSTQWTPAQHP